MSAEARNDKHRLTARSTVVSAIINVALCGVQVCIGVIASSQALIADGIHSLSDLVGDAVTLLANHGSNKQADEDHNYGHARYETAASLALGAILVLAGTGVLWAAIERIQNPAPSVMVGQAALWTAAIVILVKEGLFRYLLKIARQTGSSLLIANAWHARSDAASSLIVLCGIAGTRLGYPVLDPIAAMAVGVMIARMGWRIGAKALGDLMDRALPPDEAESIRKTLAQTPGVLNVHDLRTRLTGDHALVDAHLAVDPRISVSEGHYIARLARLGVMARHQALDVQIHIDPLESQSTEMDARFPMRADLSSVIAPILKSEAPGPWGMTLHYLDNRLDIELACGTPLREPAVSAIRKALRVNFGHRVGLTAVAVVSNDGSGTALRP